MRHWPVALPTGSTRQPTIRTPTRLLGKRFVRHWAVARAEMQESPAQACLLSMSLAMLLTVLKCSTSTSLTSMSTS